MSTLTSVEINGKVYEREVAKIESTFLGVEDHGMFTFILHLNYGGGGQGAGFLALDNPVQNEDGTVRREGTAYGLTLLMEVLRACGVQQWEQLRGRTIVAIRERQGFIRGLEPLPTERGQRVMFADVADRFRGGDRVR